MLVFITMVWGFANPVRASDQDEEGWVIVERAFLYLSTHYPYMLCELERNKWKLIFGRQLAVILNSY